MKNLMLALPVLIAAMATADGACAQTSSLIHHVTKPQIDLVQRDKAVRTATEQKIDPAILDSIRARKTGQVLAGAPHMQPQALTNSADGIEVELDADVSQNLLDQIPKLGGKLESSSVEGGRIRAYVPESGLLSLAARKDVKLINPAAKRTPQSSPDSEGDIAHAANLARQNFAAQGAGIKIGVISDSIDDGNNSEEQAFSDGVLDRDKVTVLKNAKGDLQDGDGTGEGLAMLEIVHAIAPGAKLYFATGGPASWDMAANIRALRDAGCRIIVDDLTYSDESPFQDNVISRAINDVSASGVLYFSSARNAGNMRHNTSTTWEGDFHDGGPAGTKFGAAANARIHVFEGGVTLNTVDNATGTKSADLFWSDPLGHSANDYDLFVVDAHGQIVRRSNRIQNGHQDPYEHVEGIHPGQSLIIVKQASAQSRFLHLEISGGKGRLRHSTPGSVRGHNASGAMNAFSVAAISAPSPPSKFGSTQKAAVEWFSSDGPRRIFFHPDGSPITPGDFSSLGGTVLQKPDIAAADGVSTSYLHPSHFNPFFGTSAAAPQAAAIAGLLLSCSPGATPAQIRGALEKSAIPIEGASPNSTAGHGIVMADMAAKAVCAANAPVSSPTTSVAQP